MVSTLKRITLFMWALLVLLPISLLSGLLGLAEIAASVSLALAGKLYTLVGVMFMIMAYISLVCAWLIYYEWIGPNPHFTRRRWKGVGLMLGIVAAAWLAMGLQGPFDAGAIFAAASIISALALIIALCLDKRAELIHAANYVESEANLRA
ncbi:hypothetical protein [Pseudomonas sp.]|uniref:hypothetical protein n=1 Tax=Pseudomonas sp. TaxID=306 RepID=UPI0028B05341|nr:hypothetical protein [Pseudomonas sp.]